MSSPERTTSPKTERKSEKQVLSPKSRTLHKKGTSLHDAAFNGDIESLKNLVKKGKSNVNNQGPLETSPLHEAAFSDQVECVKFLLENGAEVNIKDKEGASPLQHAAFNGSLRTLKILLESGADPTSRDKEGSTPIHKAAYQGYAKCLRLLVTDKDVDIADEYGTTALHHTAAQGHLECMKFLVESKAKIDAIEKDGSTAMHKAAMAGHMECVQFLIASGASPDTPDSQGASPLHYACEQGHRGVAAYLIDKGAKVNRKDQTHVTPLHNACFNGHVSCVQLLCEKGAKINRKKKGTTPTHHAAFNGHTQILSLLVAAGANVNSVDVEGATPLHKASFNGHLRCVEMLIEAGAQTRVVDDEGSTPLHCAAYSGHHQCLSLLVTHQADINAKDSDDGTPLHNAAFNGHVECLKILVENGAALKSEDCVASTPLHHAAQRGNKTCVSYLIKNGATVDHQNDRGMTPLHMAVKYPPCVSRLLKANAQVDVRDWSGRTALYYAVRANMEDSARMLIFKGADIHSKDQKGKAPINASKVLNKQVLSNISKEKLEYEEAQTHKEFKVAVKKFNVKPKHGVAYLIESKVFQGTPNDIAKFLHAAEGLSKTMIGDYLGEHDDFVNDVLTAFINRMDFVGFEFDHALRYFLSKFRLPGEAQKIDRIMEAFSLKYTTDNPNIFNHEDTAYLLAFSMIMLNTDAHNPNIKKERKMSKEQWIKNTKSIPGGMDLEDSYLERLFHKIVKEEIKMETEGGGMHTHAEKKGYLVKQGGRIKTWKKRWFVISDNCLYYFKTHEDHEPIGIVPLENLAVKRVPAKKKFAFEIYQPEQNAEMKSAKFDAKGAVIKGHHDSYVIGCADQEELDEWVKVIESNIFKNPFLELVRKKLANQKGRVTRPRSQSGEAVRGRKSESEKELLKINFKTMYELANMCAMLPKESSKITDKYGLTTMVGNLGKRYLFYSTVNNDTKTQYIIIGSFNWNSKGLKKDYVLWHQNDKKRDIRAFYKMTDAAKQIFSEVSTQLKKEHQTVVAGYSLLSSICPEVALILLKEGFKVKQVMTFGQPAIESKEAVQAYQILNYTRVLDIRDPVASLFPKSSSGGNDVILLTDKYHTNSESDELSLDYSEEFYMENSESHSMENYLSRIQPKLKESVLISFSEKDNYK
eukprot:TRINITY_DN1107_c0_g2_i1.p1 TRINITY_DN1107_c0_g2~~TRINITY_DN1107_c0_g2_i1.p1  ORF type:complete len:1152 (-),score=404.61 TRINITY_DN1107_c0_g2_i1:97-3552(-)